MRISTMNGSYPIRMQYLDSGNSTEFRNPAPVSAPGPPKASAFSPAVVAVIGVLAGAFLIISYYRIFLKYCNSHHLSIWGTRSDTRNGGPSTIVLMEEHSWPPDALGLDEALISRIPTCKYKAGEGIVDGTECSVCLGEFEEGEELRILPKCNHPFHIPCIDTWLAASSTCPLCRVNIVLAAAVPYALLPVEREPPVGPTMSFVPAAAANPMQALINHEIEMLQEQHVQEFLEAGQLSGPPSRRSSRSSSFAPEMMTPDTHRIDMPEMQPTRETPRPPVVQRSVSHRQVANKPTGRLYSRARSGNRKHPLSSPQRKRFARLLTGSSRSTGSSSMNQVVVELLAQEIFQTSTSTSTISTSDPGKLPRATSSTGTSSTGTTKKIRHDNASFELMWSIDEQENPLMWSVNEDPGSRTLTEQCCCSSSEDEMEDLAERLADSMDLRSNPGSDSEDYQDVPAVTKRMVRSNSSGSAWPSQRHSLNHSMSRLKRYGSASSLRRFEKVHASDPVFEMFEVD